MNKHVKISLMLLFALAMGRANAQETDSLFVIDAQYDSILRSNGEAMNTLFYKHNKDVLISNLGPFGSPFYYPTAFHLKHQSLLEQPHAINSALHKISGYKPYTNITYINASRKEQHFYLKHIQEFGKLLFFNFDLKKISSPGAFINQEANNTIFTAALKYQSEKGNYDIRFSTGIYRNSYEENGGLTDASIYETQVFDDALNYEVNLKSSNASLKNYQYQLEQRLDLFRLNSDSLSKKAIYLKHQIGYTTQQKVFYDNDPLSNLYTNIYLDSISSIDSIYNNNISNTGALGIQFHHGSVEFFGQHDQKEYVQSYGLNKSYYNTYAGLRGHFKKETLAIDFIGKYGVKGYRSEDVATQLLVQNDKEKYTIAIGASYFLTEADLKMTNYVSNHFIWLNPAFEKQGVLDLHLNFHLKKAQLELRVENKIMSNTFYYDSLAIANQADEDINITSFSLAKDYRWWKFHFRTAVIYQLTSDQALFPLPEIVGRQVLYFQKPIFKHAMKFQFGIGFSYATEHYGYAYMPAINEFHTQEQQKLGYYPKIDVFLNTHLKRAQIFLKYEHINAGGSIEKAYVAPGYASMAKSLKFGVSWNMFN